MKIPEAYFLKEGIYVRNLQPSFNYSDGDAVENYLFDVLHTASDLSTGSEELFLAVNNWATLYHLSPKRANLLRPLAKQLQGKKVLEIGCGGGAITRFLGELGCSVVALEGSERRAMLTAQRCRDLDNVTVICDNFQNFQIDEQFDFVTLIGVLEYASLYIDGENPHLQMLQQVTPFLKPTGRLLLAIENKLGLRYWAGAPEDHLGKPYVGLENKYSRQTAETFGKTELTALIQEAGFAHTTFLYPFPDYKLPDVVLTEQAFVQDGFNAHDLLLEKFDYFQEQQYQTPFSTTQAAESMIRNHLLADLSNSFLVCASFTNPETVANNTLAYTYSAMRRKEFCKENLLLLADDGTIDVQRRYLYQEHAFSGVVISNAILHEKYIHGHLLFKDLIGIITNTGWSVQDVSAWAQHYFQILLKRAYLKNGTPWLNGSDVDLTPFNIMMGDDNSVTVFDLEWSAREDVPLYYVFFRGLIYSIGRITFYEAPAASTPLNIIQLTASIVNTIIPFTTEQLEDCFKRELFLFSEVILGEVNPFGFYDLIIRKDYKKEYERVQHELEEKQHEITGMQNQLEEFKSAMLEDISSLLVKQHVEQEKSEWQQATNHLQQALQQLQHEMKLQSERFEASLKTITAANGGQDAAHNALKQQLEEARHQVKTLQQQLQEQAAAFRQEVDTLKKELDWYKRTYEYRSLLGVVKEKIQGRIKK